MKNLILLCSICILFSSCATMLSGGKNTVSVKSANPPEAKVYLKDKELGQGVFKLRLSKFDLQEGDSLLIKSEGYETSSVVIVRKAHPWYVTLDFISTLGIGLLLDVTTGNIYRPNTANLEVDLEKEGGVE